MRLVMYPESDVSLGHRLPDQLRLWDRRWLALRFSRYKRVRASKLRDFAKDSRVRDHAGPLWLVLMHAELREQTLRRCRPQRRLRQLLSFNLH